LGIILGAIPVVGSPASLVVTIMQKRYKLAALVSLLLILQFCFPYMATDPLNDRLPAEGEDWARQISVKINGIVFVDSVALEPFKDSVSLALEGMVRQIPDDVVNKIARERMAAYNTFVEKLYKVYQRYFSGQKKSVHHFSFANLSNAERDFLIIDIKSFTASYLYMESEEQQFGFELFLLFLTFAVYIVNLLLTVNIFADLSERKTLLNESDEDLVRKSYVRSYTFLYITGKTSNATQQQQ